MGAKVPGRLDAMSGFGFDLRAAPPPRSLELHAKHQQRPEGEAIEPHPIPGENKVRTLR